MARVVPGAGFKLVISPVRSLMACSMSVKIASLSGGDAGQTAFGVSRSLSLSRAPTRPK